jgi:hypothetical protein
VLRQQVLGKIKSESKERGRGRERERRRRIKLLLIVLRGCRDCSCLSWRRRRQPALSLNPIFPPPALSLDRTLYSRPTYLSTYLPTNQPCCFAQVLLCSQLHSSFLLLYTTPAAVWPTHASLVGRSVGRSYKGLYGAVSSPLFHASERACS